MAPSSWIADFVVSRKDEILAKPEDWSFYAAVRALAAENGGAPVGRSASIEDDLIRFRQAPSLEFEANEIRNAELITFEDKNVVELTQTFFGPFGSKGALPQFVTEDALIHSADLQPFLDLFTHRMTALLYRAWETTQIAVSRDRGQADPYKVWINSLFGQGFERLRDRNTLSDDVKRYTAGWLATGRPSEAALQGLVGVVAGVSIEIEPFVPEWLPIPVNDQARLGLGPMNLGEEVIIGSRFFSVQSRVQFVTEPLNFDQFSEMLPDKTMLSRLADAVRNLAGLALSWDLRLVLKKAEVPVLSLDGCSRLGWDTWLNHSARRHHADDLVLNQPEPGNQTIQVHPG